MRYLFDTSILIHYIRESEIYQLIESTFSPFQTGNFPCISVVSAGEIKSFAIQRKWGAPKLQKLENFLAEFVLLDINHDVVIEHYAMIDAFSQNLLPGRAYRSQYGQKRSLDCRDGLCCKCCSPDDRH